MIRVAVVGARRRHQGTGFHLARFAGEAGADVRAVVGTSRATVAEAEKALRGRGIRVRGYVDLGALLDQESLDALIVASPHDAHEEALERALDARLHVLCEKPLVWGGTDPAARSRELAERFRDASLHLVVQAQWPYTLPTYRALHPQVLRSTPRSFAMELAPSRTGRRVVADAMPHPLSLLATVLPDASAEVAEPRIERLDDGVVHVRFDYVAGGASVPCRVVLRHVPEPPRPAAYGFDGLEARRHVETGDAYRMTLSGGGRTLELPDPTPLLVQDFLRRVSSPGAPVDLDASAWPGMRHLALIDAAWPEGA